MQATQKVGSEALLCEAVLVSEDHLPLLRLSKVLCVCLSCTQVMDLRLSSLRQSVFSVCRSWHNNTEKKIVSTYREGHENKIFSSFPVSALTLLLCGAATDNSFKGTKE